MKIQYNSKTDLSTKTESFSLKLSSPAFSFVDNKYQLNNTYLFRAEIGNDGQATIDKCYTSFVNGFQTQHAYERKIVDAREIASEDAFLKTLAIPNDCNCIEMSLEMVNFQQTENYQFRDLMMQAAPTHAKGLFNTRDLEAPEIKEKFTKSLLPIVDVQRNLVAPRLLASALSLIFGAMVAFSFGTPLYIGLGIASLLGVGAGYVAFKSFFNKEKYKLLNKLGVLDTDCSERSGEELTRKLNNLLEHTKLQTCVDAFQIGRYVQKMASEQPSYLSFCCYLKSFFNENAYSPAYYAGEVFEQQQAKKATPKR